MWFLKKQNILIFLLSITICIGMLGCKKEIEVPEKAFATDSNVITSAEDLEREIDPTQRVRFTISYTGAFNFPSGKSGTEGTGDVDNDTSNQDAAYVTLHLGEDEIVKTGLIPVGGKLKSFTLLKDIPVGTHEVVLKYNIVDEEKQQKIGESMGIAVELVVSE